MNKQKQIQIYFISICLSILYLSFYTTNTQAAVKDSLQKQDAADFELITFRSSESSVNEFPITVGTLSREEPEHGFTVVEWEDNNAFGFIEQITNLLTVNINWPDFFSKNDTQTNKIETSLEVNATDDAQTSTKQKAESKLKNSEVRHSLMRRKQKDGLEIIDSNSNNNTDIQVVERSRVFQPK